MKNLCFQYIVICMWVSMALNNSHSESYSVLVLCIRFGIKRVKFYTSVFSFHFVSFPFLFPLPLFFFFHTEWIKVGSIYSPLVPTTNQLIYLIEAVCSAALRSCSLSFWTKRMTRKRQRKRRIIYGLLQMHMLLRKPSLEWCSSATHSK